jgi:hypothetical protein
MRATWLYGMANDHFIPGYPPGTFVYPYPGGNYRSLENQQGFVPRYNYPLKPRSAGPTGPFELTAGDNGIFGFYDGAFANEGFTAIGSVDPAALGGFTIGQLTWGFASHGNSALEFGLYGALTQSSFTQIAFTGIAGAVALLSANADFAVVPSGPGGPGGSWRWLLADQPFDDGDSYSIVVS